MHYHVGANTPGYCADDVYAVATKKDAIACVIESAKRYRESEWDLPRRARRTGSGNAKHGAKYFTRPNDKYDLGWRIWWDTCPFSPADCGLEVDE